MAATFVTLRNPLGQLVFQETALTNVPVEMATSEETFYHFELDNTANSATTYFKFYITASAPTLASDTPRFLLPVPGNTKVFMFMPQGLNQGTGTFVIATSTLASATTQSAPANAVSMAVLG
tara:strand:+ start:976 stop:1341 length:366 start_codon:yes stop_codon:yes gene_type:complete